MLTIAACIVKIETFEPSMVNLPLVATETPQRKLEKTLSENS